MKHALAASLALLLLAGAAAHPADAPPAGNPPAPEASDGTAAPDAPADVPADTPDETAGAEVATPPSPEVFVPTEEISEDLAVSYPVDI